MEKLSLKKIEEELKDCSLMQEFEKVIPYHSDMMVCKVVPVVIKEVTDLMVRMADSSDVFTGKVIISLLATTLDVTAYKDELEEKNYERGVYYESREG